MPAGRSGGPLRSPGDDGRNGSSSVSLGEVRQARPLFARGIPHGQPHAEGRAVSDYTLYPNAPPKDLQQSLHDMEA